MGNLETRHGTSIPPDSATPGGTDSHGPFRNGASKNGSSSNGHHPHTASFNGNGTPNLNGSGNNSLNGEHDATSSIGSHPTHSDLLSALIHPRGAALNPTSDFDSPVHGQARSLGQLKLPLCFGDFDAHAFLISGTGRHVIALSKGDITTAEPLLVRFHSECITSEGLGGCDCDCVEQLNAALKQIETAGRGVVFYLRQEGRGAGYHSKARDRMGVTASDNALTTFHMYEALGLPHDPREYSAIGDCAYLLGIQAQLNVMTNNKEKLKFLESAGLSLAGRIPLEMPPNPFNGAYLDAKGSVGGHLLSQNGSVAPATYPWKVEPFRPHLVPGALRFSHEASYPLPLRPLHAGGKEMWFEAHVYHDLHSGLNYVALEYGGKLPAEERDIIVPLVRVQPESILQRFPLRNRNSTYEESIKLILERGRGMVILYPEDGKGNGFSSAFREQVMVQQGAAATPAEAARMLGTRPEARDYLPVARLLSHHYGTGPIQLIFRKSVLHDTTPTVTLLDEMRECGMQLRDPIFLDKLLPKE